MRVLGWVAVMFVAAVGCGSQPAQPYATAPPSAPPVVSSPPVDSPVASALPIGPASTSAAPTPAGAPSALASSHADTGMSWTDVACPSAGGEFDGEIDQQMDGELSTCMQVGAVAAGQYTVALEQLLAHGQVDGAAPPTNGTPTPSVQLSLSPDTGVPGTTVTVSGTLTAPLSQRPDIGDLCWDGCPGGLEYEGVNLQWTSPMTFRTTMVVPAAPWLKANPARVAPLVSGSYSIGVQCLTLAKGCTTLGPQGTATFHLQVATGAAPSWCATQASCAELNVSPAVALPGAVVRVTGFVPLAAIIGADQPYAFQLQTRAGRASGPSVSFNTPNSKEAVFAELGSSALSVLAAPTFGSLKNTIVVDQISDGFAAVVADPADPTTHAWCDGSSVVVSSARGTRTVPTATASAALTRVGFPPYDSSHPGCDAIAFVDDGAGGRPAALVVAFGVEPPDQDPMSAEVALATLDDGHSWTPVPAPPGAHPINFGDFRYQQGALLAMFNPGSPSAPGLPPLAETSRDGGRTWQPTQLRCPAAGACVTFGPFQSGNCAKGQATQALVTSADGGRTWTEPATPGWVRACAPAQLAATADGAVLLVDNMSEFTLRRSTDGGATWTDIAVPLLPEQQPGLGVGIGTDGITILPSGSLLATGQQDSGNDWLLLRPGANAWCRVTTPGSGVQGSGNSTITVIGDQLWWLTYDQNDAAAVHHAQIAALSC